MSSLNSANKIRAPEAERRSAYQISNNSKIFTQVRNWPPKGICMLRWRKWLVRENGLENGISLSLYHSLISSVPKPMHLTVLCTIFNDTTTERPFTLSNSLRTLFLNSSFNSLISSYSKIPTLPVLPLL